MMAFQDTEEGRKMASVLAMMLDGGLTADCINIEYDKKDGFNFSELHSATLLLQNKMYQYRLSIVYNKAEFLPDKEGIII